MNVNFQNLYNASEKVSEFALERIFDTGLYLAIGLGMIFYPIDTFAIVLFLFVASAVIWFAANALSAVLSYLSQPEAGAENATE